MLPSYLYTLGDEIPVDNGKSGDQALRPRGEEFQLIRNLENNLVTINDVNKYRLDATILHVAARHGYEEYATKIINLRPSLVTFMNVDGNTPLHFAAQNGNISILRKMLESGKAECTKINKQGETAFMLACLKNHVDAAIILIEETSFMTTVELDTAFSGQHPAIVDKILEKFPSLVFDVDKEQSTLLHKACVEKNLEMARTLLNVDRDIAEIVNKDGLTPLHCAAMTGSVEILKEFFNKAPSSFNSTTHGTMETVFHLAAKQKNTEAFIFMAQNSDLEELLYNLDAENNTVLHIAASVDSTSLVHFILLETTILDKFPHLLFDVDKEESTLDVDRLDATLILHEAARDGYEEYVTNIINLHPSLVSFMNVDGNTPLHLAAQNGNISVLRKMLESGKAECTKINKQGETAFMLACLNNHFDAAIILIEEPSFMTTVELDTAFSGQHPAIVDKILEKFPSLVFDVDKEQSTLLHKACVEKNLEMARTLLNVYRDIAEIVNKDGLTPLHCAAMTGSVEILKEFFNKAPSSFNSTTQGTMETVFHLAAKQKNTEAFIFMAQNSDLEELLYNLDAENNTVLHVAASVDSTSLVRFILLETTILDKFPHLLFDVDKEESTLLHKACVKGNLEMARTLLDVDQSIAELVNKNGLTPLHCAAMTGSVEILKEFLYKASSAFNSTTQGTMETVFHLAAKQKNTKAFIFMAQNADIGELLYNLDAEDNTVLHVAASVDSTSLVRYILLQTTIDATLKNKKGFAAGDLLNKDGVDYPLLSTWFRREAETIQRPSGSRYVKFAHEPVEHIPTKNNGDRFISEREIRVPRNKERKMHSESLQNARNTITIVAVLIATIAFTCGINPPGGIYQDGDFIGKATAGRTLAFKIFLVFNNIALFTSLSIVTLLVSIIPYRTKSLKTFVTIAHKMMWLAVASMAIAYAAAAWITVPDFEGSIWLVYLTAVIGIVALGGMFVYVSFMMVKHILKKGKLRRNMSRGKAPSTTLDLEAADDTGCYGF